MIDLGCGFGDTTQRLAEPGRPRAASALGVDVSEPFIELARKEAEEPASANVQLRGRRRPGRRARRDLRLRLLADGDHVLRQPGAGAAQRPRLRWRRAGGCARSSGGASSTTSGSAAPRWSSTSTSSIPRRPTSRPAARGRSRWPNADTVSEQLKIAGFEEITLQRCDLPLKIGNDLDQAVEFNMALGPAGEVLRLWEDRIDEIRPKIARRPARGAGRVRRPRRGHRPGLDLDHRRHRAPIGSVHGRRRATESVPARLAADPRAAVPALGLPLTPLRSRPRSSGSRPRCSGPASGTTRRRPPAPRAAHARAQRRLKTFRELEADVGDLDELAEMAAEDEEMAAELATQLASVERAPRRARRGAPVQRRVRRRRRGRHRPRRRRRHRLPGLGRDPAADVPALGRAARLRGRDEGGLAGGGGGAEVGDLHRPRRERLRPLRRRARRPPAGPDLPLRLLRPPPHQLRPGRRRPAGRRGRRGRDRRRRPAHRHLPRLRAPAASTSTRPTRRCGSPTSRPASSSSARTSAPRPRTRRWRCSSCARS